MKLVVTAAIMKLVLTAIMTKLVVTAGTTNLVVSAYFYESCILIYHIMGVFHMIIGLILVEVVEVILIMKKGHRGI